MGYNIKSWYDMTEDEARDYISIVPCELLDILNKYAGDSNYSPVIRLARFLQDIAALFESDKDMFEYLAAFSPTEAA